MSEIEWIDIFGTNLEEILNEQWMSRTELAEAAMTTEATISRCINKQVMPSLKTAINMAYETDIYLDDFIDFGDEIY